MMIDALVDSVIRFAVPIVGFATVFLLGATGLLGSWIKNLLRKPTRALWGEISDEELKKFGVLAVSFFLIIGAYWSLRVIKDAFFDTLIGLHNQPIAKILSPIMVALGVMLYAKLSDLFDKARLFWAVLVPYAAVLALVGYGYSLIDITAVGTFGKTLGWFSYFFIEFFGSVVVAALFWSFVASITKTDSAKRGYPVIFLAGQVGNFLGATAIEAFAVSVGFTNLFYAIAIAILIIPLVISYLVKTTPEELMVSDSGKDGAKPQTSVWEGIRLIGSHGYLMGVAVVATAYEIVGTILDFQFKMLAKQVYLKEELAAFIAKFAQMNSLIAIAFALLGTSFFLRKFGVRFCLFGFPTLALGALIGIWFYPQLYAFFFAVIIIKAFSYVLNNPVKEMLYIPTTKDVKFKAKGVIDGFGGRASKAIGSAVTAAYRTDLTQLLTVGSLISMGIVGAWVIVAYFLGNAYEKLQERKGIIG